MRPCPHARTCRCLAPVCTQLPEQAKEQLGEANMLYAAGKYAEAAELLLKVVKVRDFRALPAPACAGCRARHTIDPPALLCLAALVFPGGAQRGGPVPHARAFA